MKEKQVLDTDKIGKVDEPVDTNSKKEEEAKTEDNKYADNQYFGPWVSFKTTHAISINGTTKDAVPSMHERIQLVKPWEISPVPHILRK